MIVRAPRARESALRKDWINSGGRVLRATQSGGAGGNRDANGGQDVGPGIGLAEVSRATEPFGLGAHARLVEGGDVYDRRTVALLDQLAVHFNAGHAAELDVDQQAAEMLAQRVREEMFRGLKGDGLEAGQLQQAGKRTADACIVVDDRDVATDVQLAAPSDRAMTGRSGCDSKCGVMICTPAALKVSRIRSLSAARTVIRSPPGARRTCNW